MNWCLFRLPDPLIATKEEEMGQQPVVQQADTTCGSLLRELQHIWDEVGESDSDRDKMLLQLEQECLEVYRRKVDNASQNRARLHESLANAEVEFAALFSALGEPTLSQRERRSGTLKEQVDAIKPHLDELRRRKDERARQFLQVKSQIVSICTEIAGSDYGHMFSNEEPDLSLRRLEEYQAQLVTFQKEKSERVHKVLEYVNLIHQYSVVMGMDFFQLISEVHPSLDDTKGLPKSISNDTLDLLVKTIQSLEDEKKRRVRKLKDLGVIMLDLWKLMEIPSREQVAFENAVRNIEADEDDITTPGCLSMEFLGQAEVEVDRLQLLKISKMKEIVLKKRLELEEVCRNAHLEPDVNTSEDRLVALIESGMVDAADLLTSLEAEISRAKEEVASRKDIMSLMEKWMSACEEEAWLEDYNKDENRFASKGAHLNLKRAEKARAAIAKLPALVDTLTQRTRVWEEERNVPFMFDGVRLLAMLSEYNHLREEKEEEKRRLRDQRKLHEQLLNEKESLFGSKPSPSKNALNLRRAGVGSRASSIGGGQQTVPNRRLSLGNAIMHPGTPESTRIGGCTRQGFSGNKEVKPSRSRPAAPSNYVAIQKDDNTSAGGKHGVSARSQPQAQDTVARQPLGPVPPTAALQQLHVDDAGNRAASVANKTGVSSAAHLKSPLKVTLISPHVGDVENTIPRVQPALEFSFEERRVSNASCGDLQNGFWKSMNS